TAFVRGEAGHQPRHALDFLVGGRGQDEPRLTDGLQLDDLGDGDLPYLPTHSRLALAGQCPSGARNMEKSHLYPEMASLALRLEDAAFSGDAQWIMSLRLRVENRKYSIQGARACQNSPFRPKKLLF